jgi:hypothetical protein
MRILIVDQCSSAKKTSGRNEPLDEDTIDATSRDELVGMDGAESYPAEELYQGRQQQRITEAKRLLEDAGDEVDRAFISAGFGLVGDQEEIPLYDVTFSDMNTAEIEARADALDIHGDLRDLIVDGDYDVVFFALGNDYYRSAKLDELLPDVSEETFVVFFNRDAFEDEYDNGLSIAARTPEAKAYGTIVVALKGEYLRNFAARRVAGDKVESIADIKDYCTEEVGSQTGLDDYSSSSS